MSHITETPASQPPTRDGEPWWTLTAGDGTGPHDVADVVLAGWGGRHNKVICRCGEECLPAAYTLGYRQRAGTASGRADMFEQHRRRTAGTCVHCGRTTCHCDQR